MRFTLLAPLTCILTACGIPAGGDDPGATTTTDSAPTDPADDTTPTTAPADTTTSDDPSTGEPEPQDPAPGWSLRDQAPYGRSGHVTILDAANDRMIVYGGGANDTWQLPLSGPHADTWSELVVAGEHPPVHAYGDWLFADSAVYDPAGQRMLVLQNPTPVTAGPNADVELWELALAGAPKWRRIVTAGPDPGVEVQSGRVVLDPEENRLYIVGGALDSTGVWTLSLADPPTWERVADTPTEELGPFYAGASLLLDAAHDRLLLFGGLARLQRVWALSLTTRTWTLLDDGNLASGSYGATAALDAEHDRVVLFGGDQTDKVHLFSLTTHAWTVTGAGDASTWPIGSSGVVDPQRDRILYFGGITAAPGGGQQAINTTWSFSLADLALTELIPTTLRGDLDMGIRTAVWDPVRGAVVAFGGDPPGATFVHGLAASDGWTRAAVGVDPGFAWISGIHDPIDEAIIAFGGIGFQASGALLRLASSPGAEWETLAVPGGPAARAQHVAVLDAAHHRMIVHGGFDFTDDPSGLFTDTWALALDGPPVWTELAPAGPLPPQRDGHVAIYDPAGQRMIVYGGRSKFALLPDLWSLSLDDTPTWTQLKPAGPNPQGLVRGSAVHDPVGQRMILVDLAASLLPGEARVFALDLAGTPTWHRFCPSGLAVTDVWSNLGSAPNAVLVDDGLFVTISGGAFRFDLETAYCE